MMQRSDEWITTLSPDEISELEATAKAYLETGRDIGDMDVSDFPLPSLMPRLHNLQKTLLAGIGFEVIRGLRMENLSQAEAAAIFCGIGTHLGHARSQNAQGHILGHVRDVGKAPDDPKARIYQTSARQTFHTDSADVVGLLCMKDAKEGGLSLLASTETIYNRMMQQEPELARLLFEPIATDRRGEVPDGSLPYMTIPVLNWFEGKLTGFYQRQYIESAQRFEDAPRLTDQHFAALDLFDATANDPDVCLSMRLEPGDMQFVYNHSQLHDRTGFLDWPDPAERRHLFRLWLSMENDRPLPECFKQRYGSIEIGNRGGIIVKGTKLHAPLD